MGLELSRAGCSGNQGVGVAVPEVDGLCYLCVIGSRLCVEENAT